MARTSKADAPVSLDEPEIEGRYAELDDYTVAFETHKADMDPAPFFRGLPDDRCQCPHWGVVLSGRIIFRYPDHDEVFTAGDAYYGAPGHLPLHVRRDRAGRVQPDRPAERDAWRSSARTSRRPGRAVPDMRLTRWCARSSEKMVTFLETGTVPEGLFRPDVFLDLTMPTWRVQAAGAEDLIAVRKEGHPGPGTGDPLAGRPDADRVRVRVRGAVGRTRASSGTRGR